MGQIRYDNLDAEDGQPIAPLADLWAIAPLVMERFMQIAARYIPGHEDQIACATQWALVVHEFVTDLKGEAQTAWKIVDELHRANQVMARQLDALQDHEYVKGGRR